MKMERSTTPDDVISTKLANSSLFSRFLKPLNSLFKFQLCLISHLKHDENRSRFNYVLFLLFHLLSNIKPLILSIYLSMVLSNGGDLLNPPTELEKRRHKLKCLVQYTNSFFMDAKCQDGVNSIVGEHRPGDGGSLDANIHHMQNNEVEDMRPKGVASEQKVPAHEDLSSGDIDCIGSQLVNSRDQITRDDIKVSAAVL